MSESQVQWHPDIVAVKSPVKSLKYLTVVETEFEQKTFLWQRNIVEFDCSKCQVLL